MSEPVELTVAGSEPEAAMICGMLEQHGIEARYDRSTNMELPLSWHLPGTGPQAIWVHAKDAERAQNLLRQAQSA
ncbi:MAG TPA: DUF2007 domain-containing protein [Gaiellaceae bacterium]|nr:DUF2007 domain-containing protein [Gaiellaceae bacterium]